MEKIIYNENNLKEEEMTEIKRKVKLLLINSQNQILLAYSHNEYQFPGGTQELNETLIETVNREIEEETGIKLNIEDIKPFACSMGYYKDWPEIGKNRKVEIYYYEIKTDENPNFNNINLTEHEKEGNFELRYIDLENVEEEIKDNVKKYDDPHGITKEMLNLFKIYKEKNKRMKKNELLELLDSINIDPEEFWILSSSALVLRDLFEDAGDLDIAVTEKGLKQLKKQFNLKQKENGWYTVSDKIECVVDTKEDWKIEKVGKYYLENIKKYYEYLKSSSREKDAIRRTIVKEYLENNNN